MKFSIKKTADLVTFTEEILNGKLHFLYSRSVKSKVVVMIGRLRVDVLEICIKF